MKWKCTNTKNQTGAPITEQDIRVRIEGEQQQTKGCGSYFLDALLRNGNIFGQKAILAKILKTREETGQSRNVS
jgi:hypothetical protein